MLPRFYAPDLDRRLERVTLPSDQARHLTRVLRLGVGDEVVVFDGRGLAVRAVVEAVGRDGTSLHLLDPLPPPPAPAVPISIAQVVLKGGSMDAAVRDATMMGAVGIQPLFTAHADVKVSVARRQAALERWRRVALAAAKQCGRAALPPVGEPTPFDEWMAVPREDLTLIFVEPSARCTPRSVKSLLAEPVPPRATVLLGPEGGWSPEEVDTALRGGCVAVTLGPLTLRAESMAVAALAALAAIWQV